MEMENEVPKKKKKMKAPSRLEGGKGSTVAQFHSLALPPAGPINAIAFAKKTKLLAVGRCFKSNRGTIGVVEIWTFHRFYVIRWYYNLDPYPSSIEGLCWVKNRLLVLYVDGSLAEFGKNKIESKRRITLSASATWCLAFRDSLNMAVVGNEDGTLYVVSTLNGSLELKKTLIGMSEHRILSLQWKSDEVLLGGSLGRFYEWNVGKWNPLRVVELGDPKALVWSLCSSLNGDVVSGDSRGVVSFWKGTGGLISSHSVLQADVLALCYVTQNDSIVASGADPKLQSFNWGGHKRNAERQKILGWKPVHAEHFHTHDVRAMCSAGAWIISAGSDSNVWISRTNPTRALKQTVFRKRWYHIAKPAQLIMFQNLDHLMIFRLGSLENKEEVVSGSEPKVANQPDKLAMIYSRNRDMILASSISDEGNLIAYSSLEQTRVLSLDHSEEVPIVKPIGVVDRKASDICLSANGSAMFVLTYSADIVKCSISSNGVSESVAKKLPEPSHRLEISSNSEYIATLSISSTITLFSTENVEICVQLPCSAPVIDLTFSHSDRYLVALRAYGALRFIATKDGAKTDIARENGLKSGNGDVPLTVSARNELPEKLLLTGNSTISSLPLTEDLKEGTYRSVEHLQSICGAEWIESGDCLVVCVDEKAYQTELPPPIVLKKFGTG